MGAAKIFKLSYQDAAPAAMISASNHFEVAIATAVMIFGLSSGAALATVVGQNAPRMHLQFLVPKSI